MSALDQFRSWSDGLRIRAHRIMLLALAFGVPLSVKIYFVEVDLEVITPSEVLAGLIAGWAIVATLLRRKWIVLERSFFNHPITILLLADMGISAISMLFSNDHMVSLKWMIVRTVYLIAFYFVSLYFSSKRWLKIKLLLLIHAAAVLIVIGWTFRLGFELGFERKVSNWSCTPFYNDHTMYAAALVFVLFTFLIVAVDRFVSAKRSSASVAFVLSGIVLLALFATFGRGAWFSLFFVVALGIVILLQPKPVYWITGLAILVLSAFVLWQPLQKQALANNGDADADNSGLKEILWSYGNVSTDASNRERLVRWTTAINIFLEDPLLGCGPGMYKFKYAEHNDPKNATYRTDPQYNEFITPLFSLKKNVIVRQNPQLLYVDPGTAHSEYLLALSERGVGAFVVFLAVMSIVLYRTVRNCSSYVRLQHKIQLLLVALPIMAFGVQGVFNNFLDDCKIAFPFLVLLALFVRMDTKGAVANEAPSSLL